MNDDDIKRALAHLEDEIARVRTRLEALSTSGDAQHRTATGELHRLQEALDLVRKEVKEIPRIFELIVRVKNALSGPEDGSADGFFSKVRRLREDLDALTARFASANTTVTHAITTDSDAWKDLNKAVKELEKVRQQQIGAIAAASSLGGLLGFLLSLLLK